MKPPDFLHLEFRETPQGPVILALRGALIGEQADFEAAAASLLSRHAAKIVLDLGGVERADSRGLGSLAVVLQRARESGGRVAFSSAQGPIQRLLSISLLLQAAPLYGDAEQAVKALAG